MAMNELHDGMSVCDKFSSLLQVALAFRKQWFAINLKVGPRGLHGIWRQGSRPLESRVIASDDTCAFRGGNMLYGCADVGHAKAASDVDFDQSDARPMQTDISGIAKRKFPKPIESCFELGREGFSPGLFGRRKSVKPGFHWAGASVFTKTPLNNLGYTADHCQEGIEIGIEGSLPMGLNNRSGGLDRSIDWSEIRWHERLPHLFREELRVFNLQVNTCPQFVMHGYDFSCVRSYTALQRPHLPGRYLSPARTRSTQSHTTGTQPIRINQYLCGLPLFRELIGRQLEVAQQ